MQFKDILKLYLTLFLVLNSLVSFCQDVEVRGKISRADLKFSVSGLGERVILNDTVAKFSKIHLSDEAGFFDKAAYENFKSLFQDKRYVANTDHLGRFEIKGKLTDTLYFYAEHYVTQKYLISDLIKSDSIHIILNREKCIPYEECKEKDPKVYSFIGRKISVKYTEQPYYCDRTSWDIKYTAIYKLIQNTSKNPLPDTIKFVAYDHNSIVPFYTFQNVLLFIFENCKEFIHVKYQFYDVYETKDGKWATIGNPNRNNAASLQAKSVPVKFKQPISFDVSKLHPKMIQERYPFPYYKIKNKKAIPALGTYVEDLIAIKKEVILKTFGLKL